MFSLKPDYERTKARIEAFWHCELLDRPVVQFYLAKPPDERLPLPATAGMTSEQKWLDVQYCTELALAELSNQYFLGDTLPVVCPNLGPEIFSAFYVYDLFYLKLRHAGLPISSWTPLLHDGRYYIPSNDFSIMVSKKMYDEVFLPGIIRECQFYERSIYHLDGSAALRHLDSILAIKELNALQWVFGAGNEGYQRWIWVYQKVQKAGKAIQVNSDLNEIEMITQTLHPHGVYLNVGGVSDLDSAQALLKRLEKWTVNKW
jgi:hypothetical protein